MSDTATTVPTEREQALAEELANGFTEADRQRQIRIEDMLTEWTPLLPKIAALGDIFEQMGAMMGNAAEHGVNLLGLPTAPTD